MILYDIRFMEIARPIIEHKEYQKMKLIKHHDESVYEHSIKVAYNSFLIAFKRGWDWVSTIRGALLHDFFLYKFKKCLSLRIVTDSIKHASVHPKIALENSKKYFILNNKEENIIKGHMFPFGMPKSKEAWIVSYVDKYIATFEYCSNFKKLTMKKKLDAYNIE